MEVMKLLESQNRCLANFLSKSEAFLAEANLGNFSALQHFQKYREKTLKALELCDNRITTSIGNLTTEERTPSLIQSAKNSQQVKEELIQSILKIDQQIILKIEEERSRLLGELSTTNRNNKMVKKFRSQWVSGSGEKLDGKL